MRSNVTSASQSTKNVDSSARTEKKFLFNNIKSLSTFQASSKIHQHQSVNYSDYFHMSNLTPKTMIQTKKFSLNADGERLRHLNILSQILPSPNMRSKTEDSLFQDNSLKDQDKINRLKNIYTPSIHTAPKISPIKSFRSFKRSEALSSLLERVGEMIKKFGEREEQFKKKEAVMQKQIDLLKAKVKIYEDKHSKRHELNSKTPDKLYKQLTFQTKRQ